MSSKSFGLRAKNKVIKAGRKLFVSKSRMAKPAEWLLKTAWRQHELVDMQVLPGNRTDIIEIEPGRDGSSYPPNRLLDPQQRSPEKVTFPPVEASRLENQAIDVSNDWTYDTNDKCLWVDRIFFSNIERYNGAAGHLKIHNSSRAFVRTNVEGQSVPEGIFLGGHGSFNYYHWLIEILPKVQALPKIDPKNTLPLLVSERVETIPSFMEAIKALCPDRKLVFLAEGVTHFVNRIWVISPFVSAPFNLRDDNRFLVKDFLTRREALQFVGQGLVKKFETQPSRYPRVFLARPGGRRNYNQEAVIEAIRPFGFIPIFMEKHTLQEQIDLFANAECIVGPTGAAWANLCFAKPGTRAICWMPDQLGDFCAFSNIAGKLGIDLQYIRYASDVASTSRIYRAQYEVDSKMIADAVKKLL